VVAHSMGGAIATVLAGLDMPRTFIYPEQDPPLGGRQLRSAGVTLVPVAGAGHNVMLDNPEEFIRAVAAHSWRARETCGGVMPAG
jgi:pimeloyl-ACP methyl ester carboxylesterase